MHRSTWSVAWLFGSSALQFLRACGFSGAPPVTHKVTTSWIATPLSGVRNRNFVAGVSAGRLTPQPLPHASLLSGYRTTGARTPPCEMYVAAGLDALFRRRFQRKVHRLRSQARMFRG